MMSKYIRKQVLQSIFVRNLADVKLTTETYGTLLRKPFNKVNDQDINVFQSILDNGRVLTNIDDVKSFNIDWMNAFRGQSKVVLRPTSANEVSAILKYCNERLLAIVPQGGNTGLVGGSVPIFDEIILSMSLMDKIHSIDDIGGCVVCEAGVILEKLESEINKHDLCMPLDLGAKGSCQIGGNVSTNAGGIRLLRYGSLHGSVLGLKVVLPDGEILDLLTSLRKDNTGYDLKHLFIGAEGTLGVVTDVSILCPPKPKSINVAYFGCSTFNDALQTLKIAKSKLGEILSAFELMDKQSISCVADNLGLQSPLQSEHGFHVLVETSGSNEEHDQEKLNSFLKEAMEAGCVQDGIVAQDISQIKTIWQVRENVNRACQRQGYVYKFDYSVDISETESLIALVRKNFDSEMIRVVGYGHVGDGSGFFHFATYYLDH